MNDVLKPRSPTDHRAMACAPASQIVKQAARTLFLLGSLQGAVGASAVDLRDDRGTTVHLAAPATRIIAMAPHLTEIAFAAGAGDKLIAVSAYSDYPPEALRLPRVGDGARVDIERMLTLKPDLVLAWKSGNQAGDIAKLERLGIPVWVSEASRLGDIPRLLRGVAALAGTSAAGERAAEEFERELSRLRNRDRAVSPRQQPLPVFYEIWHQPLLTVNGAHMINEAITLCGGRNVFAQAAVLTPSVALEAVLAARPQLILGGGSDDGEADFLARWRRMPVAALRAIPAHYVAPDGIQRPSPRIIDGIRVICRHVDEARSATQTLIP